MRLFRKLVDITASGTVLVVMVIAIMSAREANSLITRIMLVASPLVGIVLAAISESWFETTFAADLPAWRRARSDMTQIWGAGAPAAYGVYITRQLMLRVLHR